MPAPRLSVVMSVYDDEPFVGAAIDSITGQTIGDFEFLIIDDRSTDGSAAVIADRAARDSRIHILPSPEKGRVPALNALLREARAPWIALMDSDDLSTPDRFAKQLAFLDAHPDHGVIGCEASLIGPDGEPVTRPPIRRPTDNAGLVANLESGPLINHNAVIYSREAALRAGGYRKAYRHAEDYDLWLRLSRITKMANLPEALVAYRLYPGQTSERHVVEQTRNAAIGWLAHCETLAGRVDPTEGLDALPALDALDAMFGPGSAAYVRRRVIDRTLYSAEALSGEGWPMLIAHAGETRERRHLWRAAARLLRHGRPIRAARLAAALAGG